METKLGELMQAVVGDPPHQVTAEAVRRHVVRRRVLECAAVTLALAVLAVIIPAGIRAFGDTAGPSAGGSPLVPTAYVSGGRSGQGTVTPITVATNRPGRPIKVGGAPTFIAVTPDGRTLYVADLDLGTVTPITVATKTPGKPIKVDGAPVGIAVMSDGKTLYVSDGRRGQGTVTPITVATNTPGKPIKVGGAAGFIAITP